MKSCQSGFICITVLSSLYYYEYAINDYSSIMLTINILHISISFKGTKIKSEMVDRFADLLKLFEVSSLQELKYVQCILRNLGEIFNMAIW